MMIWIRYPNLAEYPRYFSQPEFAAICPPNLAKDYALTFEEHQRLDSMIVWAWRRGEYDYVAYLRTDLARIRAELFEMEIVLWELWAHSQYFIPVVDLCFQP